MTTDPVRLLEDPSAGALLRGDLVHAAQAEVQGLDLAAGLAALQKATATVTSSTTVVAGTSLLTKLGIGAGVAAGAVALWLGVGRGPSPDHGDGDRVAPPAVASTPEPALDDPRGAAEVRAASVRTTADARAPVEPEVAEPAPAEVEAATLEAEAEVAEPEPEVAEPEPEVAEPTPKPTASRRKEAAGDRSTETSEKAGAEASAAADTASDGVLREAKLVAKARRSLARDPAQALALAEEAERDFPQGQLVEERRAIAIRALVALGRLDEAQRRAAPFLAEYGRGAHAGAVRRALEGVRAP